MFEIEDFMLKLIFSNDLYYHYQGANFADLFVCRGMLKIFGKNCVV